MFASLRLKIVAAYVLVILLALFLISIYILSSLKEHFYEKERELLFTKANVVVSTILDKGMELGVDFDYSIKDLFVEKPMRLVIIDKSTFVIYDNEEANNIKGKLFVRDTIITALSGSDADRVYQDDDIVSMSVAVPVVKDGELIGAVYISESLDEIELFIADMQARLITLTMIISIVIAVFGALLAGMVSAPLVKLTAVADEIAGGSFPPRVPVHGHDEIARLGEAFNTMTSQLMTLEEKRRTFVSDASHELKTPLASIKLLTESILQTPDIDPDMLREFLGDMTGEVDRLSRIVDRLLTLTKTDSPRGKSELVTVNMRRMIADIVRKLVPLAREKQTEISFQCDLETELEMLLDKDKIYEAVYNIVDNSIKYTEPGGWVKVRLATEPTTAIIEVEDSGVGIPKSEIGLIFERFYRVDKARARETGGTGLGLAIAQEAVNMHGGHIEVFSEEEQGSRFVIILPYTGK